MRVDDAMSRTVLSVGPQHTLRQAAELMADRNVGSAVVLDPDGEGPGIVTERDVLRAVAAGADLDAVSVADYLTGNAGVCEPGSSLEEAAQSMADGGYRHVVVVSGAEVVGVLSMRDIVRCWLDRGQPPR